jgi:hypothetical protein
MIPDNPIEEIWRIRDQLSAAENYDVHRLFERLRREQKQYAGRLVHGPIRRTPVQPSTALREEPPLYGGEPGGTK